MYNFGAEIHLGTGVLGAFVFLSVVIAQALPSTVVGAHSSQEVTTKILTTLPWLLLFTDA